MACIQKPPVANCPGPRPAFGTPGHVCTRCVAAGVRAGPHGFNLRARRGSITAMAQNPDVSGSTLQTEWNSRADTVISTLFDACFAEARDANPGPAAMPAWAFCVSGSGARQEACPYSDLDCFLLVESESPGVVAILRDAAQRMSDTLFGMGEAGDIDTMGIRFCDGGLHPLGLGISKCPELIGTPARIASLIEDSAIDEHIRNGLSESRMLTGTQGVHDTYLDETEAIRGKSLSAPWRRPLLPGRKKLGLKLVELGASRSLPDLTDSIDIKTDVYRMPQFVLGGLAAYYGEREMNSFKIVVALRARGKLSAQWVRTFNQVLETVARLRTAAHLTHHREADLLRAANLTEADNTTVLSEADLKKLRVCRMHLVAIKNAAEQFVEAKKSLQKKHRTNPFA